MTLDLSSGWLVLLWLSMALLALLMVRRWGGLPQARSRHRTLLAFRGVILAALLIIGLNPVSVAVTPGSVQRPEVPILLDGSQSMLLGSPNSRWHEAVALLREALERQQGHADVRIHRFGQRLVSVDREAFLAGKELARPEDPDTQLATALRQLANRLGREAPAGVVILSDGRVRESDKIEEIAPLWRRLKVPLHVVPVGRATGGGDVAILGAVAPGKARKHSQVEVDVFLRSFGFSGQRVELQLQALDESGKVRRTLATLPVTLNEGVEPVTLAFRAEPDLKRLRLHIPVASRDLAPGNNEFPLEIEIDRTKIRVLFIEGALQPGTLRSPRSVEEPGEDSEAPYAPFRDALLADPDIECIVYTVPGNGEPRRILTKETSHLGKMLPETQPELLAYDVLVLSNTPRSAMNDQVLGWVDEWIGKRGGGLLMAGGPRAFGAGGWAGSVAERLLPVEFQGASDWDSTPGTPEPATADLHPIWRLYDDERVSRAAIRELPESLGRNSWVRVKPQSGTLLGSQKAGSGMSTPPLLAIGAYGRGRTAALATPLSAVWSPRFTQQWGEQDNRHFARFARNMIYWLAEPSVIGRRRLVAAPDKRFYRPGETVTLSAQTYDEAANRTGRYRVVAMLEPRQFDGADLPPCPVKWPVGRPRTPGESGSLVNWGEEIELHRDPQARDYTLALPLVEALANGAAGQAFKVELTAYEGPTQIDSSSLDVQVLTDPQEQQNPLPNREFLTSLARETGGREITDANMLADILTEVPIAQEQPQVRRTPLWSRAWILGGLLTLLAAEWFWRRWLGLA